jgi:RimJ/RimL family protein N-acetyltransferase
MAATPTLTPTFLEGPSPALRFRSDVRLRPVRLEDWPVIHEWSRLPDIPRHQPWGPNRALQTRDYVIASIEAADTRPQVRHALAAVIANRVVGLAEVTVTRCHRDLPDQAEMGYAVHPAMRRQGVGSAIAALATDYAFHSIGVHRVHATVDVLNQGSVRVLESVGYRLEATLREDVRLVDRWRDSHVFALLEHEWVPPSR